MILESNKIYPVMPYRDAFLCPTLSIKGTAQIYTSLSVSKPTSISDMFLQSDLESNKCNTVVGMIRWVCAVYSSGTIVEECGLINTPYGGI